MSPPASLMKGSGAVLGLIANRGAHGGSRGQDPPRVALFTNSRDIGTYSFA